MAKNGGNWAKIDRKNYKKISLNSPGKMKIKMEKNQQKLTAKIPKMAKIDRKNYKQMS